MVQGKHGDNKNVLSVEREVGIVNMGTLKMIFFSRVLNVLSRFVLWVCNTLSITSFLPSVGPS